MEQVQFTLPDWTFTDLEGCDVMSGEYTLVAEIPEFHLSSIQSIQYEHVASSECESPLDIELNPEVFPTETGFNLSLESYRPQWRGRLTLDWTLRCDDFNH